jgi:hypothetical protein
MSSDEVVISFRIKAIHAEKLRKIAEGPPSIDGSPPASIHQVARSCMLAGLTRHELLLEQAESPNLELPRVTIHEFDQDPNIPGRFTATATIREGRAKKTVEMYYDFTNGDTGPEDVPWYARNRLRFEVQKSLPNPEEENP